MSGDAKRVAAIILGHFNTKTGQCDPGTERLMSKAKVSKRTVVNATNELHRLGLVVKIRHGGNGFRSRYQPNWRRFREIVEASECDEDEPQIVQKGAPKQCKRVHLDSAKPCTLTHVRNSSKKLIGADGASGGVEQPSACRLEKPVSAERLHGLMRGSVRALTSHKRLPPSVVDPQADVRLRIDTQVEGLGSTLRSIIDQRMTPEIQHEAIVAELKMRGAGLPLIIDRVSQAPRAERPR